MCRTSTSCVAGVKWWYWRSSSRRGTSCHAAAGARGPRSFDRLTFDPPTTYRFSRVGPRGRHSQASPRRGAAARPATAVQMANGHLSQRRSYPDICVRTSREPGSWPDGTSLTGEADKLSSASRCRARGLGVGDSPSWTFRTRIQALTRGWNPIPTQLARISMKGVVSVVLCRFKPAGEPRILCSRTVRREHGVASAPFGS